MNLAVFTVEEANRMAAELRPQLERLVHAKREFDRCQSRIDVLSLATSGADPGNPDARELRTLQGRCEVLTERMRRGVHAIQVRGPLVKDLSVGLVDFYSLAGDRLIFLCWRLGETEVSHWHTLDGGFANRQPLNRTEQE